MHLFSRIPFFLAAIPLLGLAQSVSLGDYAKLHTQGNFGLLQWYFPKKGIAGQSHFSTQGLAEGDITLSFAPNIPLEFRLHPRFNWDPDRNYTSPWGLQLPPLWIDDAYFDWFTSHFEIRAGYQIFSWKTVESYSQADILNQTDREIDLFDSPKIGELSIRTRFIFPTQNQNVLELYYLPYFTPSTLPGKGNRYDFFQEKPHQLIQDPNAFTFSTSEKEWFPQWAMRYQTQWFGYFDVAAYYFHGYRRFPLFMPIAGPAANGSLTFTQNYIPMHQGGLTFQGALGSWLWKGETAYIHYEQNIRSQRGNKISPYFAYTTGFEYTFYAPLFQNQDLGTILEFIGDTDAGKDENRLEGFRPFRSHMFLGSRYTFNNSSDRALLAGLFLDYLEFDRIYRVQYSERLFNKVSIQAEITGVLASGNSQFQPFENAARASLEAKYNF